MGIPRLNVPPNIYCRTVSAASDAVDRPERHFDHIDTQRLYPFYKLSLFFFGNDCVFIEAEHINRDSWTRQVQFHTADIDRDV